MKKKIFINYAVVIALMKEKIVTPFREIVMILNRRRIKLKTLKEEKRKLIDSMVLGDDPSLEARSLSTGSRMLDNALCGGLRAGTIIEFFGNPMSGKTSIALMCIAEEQKLGHSCVYIDAEKTFSADWAESMGICLKDLKVSKPYCGEDAIDLAEELVKAGTDLIVIDSIPALTPRDELEKPVDARGYPLQAKLINAAVRQLNSLNHREGNATTIIFINQVREKIGIAFGSPLVRPGGKALKFFASVVLHITRGDWVEKDGEKIGNVIKVGVLKNKFGRPTRTAEFIFNWDKKIDVFDELIRLSLLKGVLVRKGAWYFFGDEKFQGKDALVDVLKTNQVFFTEIEEELKNSGV